MSVLCALTYWWICCHFIFLLVSPWLQCNVNLPSLWGEPFHRWDLVTVRRIHFTEAAGVKSLENKSSQSCESLKSSLVLNFVTIQSQGLLVVSSNFGVFCFFFLATAIHCLWLLWWDWPVSFGLHCWLIWYVIVATFRAMALSSLAWSGWSHIITTAALDATRTLDLNGAISPQTDEAMTFLCPGTAVLFSAPSVCSAPPMAPSGLAHLALCHLQWRHVTLNTHQFVRSCSDWFKSVQMPKIFLYFLC